MPSDPRAVYDALQVLVLTPHIAAYLREYDPKALQQARAALGYKDD